MKPTHSYFKKLPRSKRVGTKISTGVLVVFLLLLFIYGVKWFRSQPVEAPLRSDLPVVTSSEGVQPTESSLAERPVADLHDVNEGSATGQATRDIEEDRFHHVVKASLPGISEEYYMYEGWLIRPIPFDYFSTGEMVHNESGEWVLEWFGEENFDYSAFTDVVITREPRDGNPAPDLHILEGVF